MNISKSAKITVNANNSGSINATPASIVTGIKATSSASTNTSIVKKTNVGTASASTKTIVNPIKVDNINNVGMIKNNSKTAVDKLPLFLKFHGMPGVGVIGLTGDQGVHGNSIYFGYINDFFDGVNIDAGNVLYALTERMGLGAISDKVYYNRMIRNKLSNDTYRRYIESTHSTYYFTGAYDTAMNTYKYDIDDHDRLMYNMLASANGQSTISYKKYVNKLDTPTPTNSDKYNITSEGIILDPEIKRTSNLTYDDRDAIAEIIFSKDQSQITSISDIYTPQIIGNNDFADFIETKDAYDYIKEVLMNGNAKYVLGPDQFYALAKDNNVTIKEHGEDGTQVKFLDPYDVTTKYYYLKTAFLIMKSEADIELFKRVITDSNSIGFFGLNYELLFNVESSSDQACLKLKDSKDILRSTDEQLKLFLQKYLNSILKYVANLANEELSVSREIKYVNADNSLTYFVPLSLSSKYKTGDILYFYTESIDEGSTPDIQYMVCITDDMAGCTTDELISYALESEPFQIKNMYASNEHVRCFNNAAVLTSGILYKNLYISAYTNLSATKLLMRKCFGLSLLNATKSLGKYPEPAYEHCTDALIEAFLNNQISLTVTYEFRTECMERYDKMFNKSCVNILDNYTDSTLILANAYEETNKLFMNINAENLGIQLYSGTDNCMHISSNNTIKLNKLYINKNNLTTDFNCELRSSIYDDNIIFKDGNFIAALDNILSYIDGEDSKTYAAGSVYREQYFKNVDLEGYFIGYDLYDADGQIIQSVYSSDSRLDVCFPVDINALDPIYYVLIYAMKEGCMKFVSRMSLISLTFADRLFKNPQFNSPLFRNVKNIQAQISTRVLTNISIEVLGDNSAIVPNNIGNKIIHAISNIDVLGGDITLDLYCDDESLEIKDVMFNHKNPGLDGDYEQITSWLDATKIDDTHYKLSIAPNLPLGKTSLFEYAVSYNDSDESKLFDRLNNDVEKDYCKQRSILVTVAYTDSEDSYIKYQNFNVILPEFVDTRDCPNISLNMHYGITDTQQYNTVENGVLCNQFITYMDVNIENFQETWGQYVSDDVSIHMDVTLKNISSDLDWQHKNLINSGFINRSTIKFLMTNSDIRKNKSLENYVKLDVVPFRTSLKLSSICNNIDKLEDDNIVINTSTFINNNKLESMTTLPANVINASSGEYVIIDSNAIKTAVNAEYIYYGILKNINIDIKNIALNSLNDNTLKFKFLYEIGNPIISNLYLRFAVLSIKITLTKGDLNYTFSVNVPSISVDNYLLNYVSDYNYSYRFMSDKLDVMFNPLSYTVCPEDAETTYSAIKGSIEKTGMPGEIQKSLRFYNSDIYNDYTLMNSTAKDSRQSLMYNWSGSKLKKRYLQDNIKDICVKPISFEDIIGNDISNPRIDKNNVFLQANDYDSVLSGYYLDTLAGDKYLSVIYNGALMNPQYRDDTYSFIYNEHTYELDRYSQVANNYPAWVSDGCAMEMRSDALIKSMDAWNDEYNYVAQESSETNILFKGVLSLYGNGYAYLPLTADTGQYQDSGVYSDEQIALNKIENRLAKLNSISSRTSSLLKQSLISRANKLVEAIEEDGVDVGTTNATKYKDVLSLEETQNLNDVYIYDTVIYDRILGADATIYEPYTYEYLRAFLYNINWVYPKYSNNSEVQPYRMVSAFDYLLKVSSKARSAYQLKWNKLVASADNINEIVPYTLLYSVYPRVAYNDENDTLNCFMLRRPTIGTDTDIDSFDKCYVLNKRYFNLANDTIKQLTIPYTVK